MLAYYSGHKPFVKYVSGVCVLPHSIFIGDSGREVLILMNSKLLFYDSCFCVPSKNRCLTKCHKDTAKWLLYISSVAQTCTTLQFHGLQHTRLSWMIKEQGQLQFHRPHVLKVLELHLMLWCFCLASLYFGTKGPLFHLVLSYVSHVAGPTGEYVWWW